MSLYQEYDQRINGADFWPKAPERPIKIKAPAKEPERRRRFHDRGPFKSQQR